MPFRFRAPTAALATAVFLAAAPASAQTAAEPAPNEQAAGEQAPAPAPAPYARGTVPAYQPPAPIGRAPAPGPATAAAPVGAVSIDGTSGDASAAGKARPVVSADPVYSDPDLAPIRSDPYSLSRHIATQAGGEVTPYAPPQD